MLMLRTMITMESQISLNLNAGRGTDLYIYTLLVRIVFYPGLKAGFYPGWNPGFLESWLADPHVLFRENDQWYWTLSSRFTCDLLIWFGKTSYLKGTQVFTDFLAINFMESDWLLSSLKVCQRELKFNKIDFFTSEETPRQFLEKSDDSKSKNHLKLIPIHPSTSV